MPRFWYWGSRPYYDDPNGYQGNEFQNMCDPTVHVKCYHCRLFDTLGTTIGTPAPPARISCLCLQVLPQRIQLTSSLVNHTPKLALYSTCPAGGPGSNAYLLQEQDPDFNSCSKLVYDSSVAGSFWLMLEGFDLESSSAVS